MAIVSNPWQDEDDEQKQGQGSALIGAAVPSNGMVGGQPTGQAQGQQLSKGSAFASSATTAGAAPGSPAPKAGSSSGAWTNLNQYLEANRGAGANMAGSVTGNTQKKVDTFKADATGVETGVTSQIDAGTYKGPDLSAAVKADPVKVRNEQKDVFKKQWDAFYQGPKSASEADGAGVAKVNTQRKGIDQDVQDFGTDAGRQRLARDTFQDPKYSRGEQTFDAFLMGNDGGDTFEGARKATDGYAKGWEHLEERVGLRAKSAEDTTNAAREGLRAATTGATGAVKGRVDTAQADVTRKNEANNARYQDILGRAQRGDDTAFQEMGYAPGQAARLLRQGFRPEQIIADARDLSLRDAVDDETIAQLAALQELQGLDSTGGYQFGTRGGKDSAFDVDSVRLGQATEFDSLLQGVEGRLAEQGGARKSEQDAVRSAASEAQRLSAEARKAKAAVLAAGAKSTPAQRTASEELGKKAVAANEAVNALYRKYGVDPGAYLGMDIGKYVSYGRDINREDVMTADERSKFPALLAALGIGGVNTVDAGDEGAAVRIDKATLDALLAANKPPAQKGTTMVVAPQATSTRNVTAPTRR